MSTADFQEKNLEWITPESATEELILKTLHFTQGLFNGSGEFDKFDPGNLNAVEYLYKMTTSPMALFTTDEYIQFLNKYNLRCYLDISKL